MLRRAKKRVGRALTDLLDRTPVNDETYIKAKYYLDLHRPLNLATPTRFNEKIHWLKLYGYDEHYSGYADKYEVRSYVSQKIGDQYLNQLYFLWDNVEEIDFIRLPEKFVIKATHGCGWNIICEDKAHLDVVKARQKLSKWMKNNYYYHARELVYKNIRPRLVCEAFLQDRNHQLNDYKFFCFNGRVHFIQVDIDRFQGHKRNFYTADWELCPFTLIYPNSSREVPRPAHLQTMIELAQKLSEGFPFIRVDFYDVDGTIIFGEMTFYPEGGFGKFTPDSWDFDFGKLLTLPAR